MNKTTFILAILIIAFFLIPISSLNAQVVELQWNTFLGSSIGDYGYGITCDESDHIFLIGSSSSSWGSPLNAHSGGDDVFVACLDSSGGLLWNTFLGSSAFDGGYGITLGSSGNIYVTGHSYATWGTPINTYSGNGDAFVASLDSSGNLVWNTFLGSIYSDNAQAISADSSGNLYVTGWSSDTWGTPINLYTGNTDIFVACLDSSGNLNWNTFLGSSSVDRAYDIVLNNSGQVFVTGYSYSTWGLPINNYSGADDIFVVCLNISGYVQWNTFLGSSTDDYGYNLALDSSSNVYLTGESKGTWGSPLNAHSGGCDVFVACLNNSGYFVWNTFLGFSSDDRGYGIIVDNSENIYVTGESTGTWGSPISAYSGGVDGFIACLTSSGNLDWNTFLGSTSTDDSRGITQDSYGNIYVTGSSLISWGTPITAHSGQSDVFVAVFSTSPLTDITANDSDGPISITESETLKIKVSLNRYGSNENVDYWLAYKGPSGWVHYNNATKKWETGLGVTHQGPLMDLNNKKVFQKSGLAPGSYTFYFGVDMVMDGKVTKSSLYKDEVQVSVTQ